MTHPDLSAIQFPSDPKWNPLYLKAFEILTVGTALFSACADAASVVTVLPAAAYEFAVTRRGAAQRADLSVRDNMMI